MDFSTQSWDDHARDLQQEWYEVFGDRDWDRYDLNSTIERCSFMQNVGHAIYGLPDENPSDDNFKTGYSCDKIKHIHKMCDVIEKQHKNTSDVNDQCVLIGIIYVYMQIDQEELSHIPTVLFRVMKHDGKTDANTFIDIDCRVYVSWKDYLKNNKLPNCKYCYPCNGVYNGDDHDQVLVDFNVTPAGKLKSKIFNGLDIAGTVVSVGGSIVAASALVFPVTAPVLVATAVSGAVVGGYGIGRSVDNIVDLKTHGQSISLKDCSARAAWLSLGASAVGMASAGATRFTSFWTASGNVLGRTGQLAVNATQISSITLNGMNIVNTVWILHKKRHSDTGVTPLDIFQLSASILFFTNSVVNFKLAQTIIQETQQTKIKNFESSLRSNRHMKAFARLVRNTRNGLDPMHGNAKVIKSINQISNPDEFFGVVRVQKQFGQTRAEVSFSDSGHIVINNNLVVDPAKFAGVAKTQRLIVLEASKQFAEGSISQSQYEAIAKPVLDEHGLLTLNTKSTSRVCGAFGVNALTAVKVCGRSIFAGLRSEDFENLMQITIKLISPHIVPTAIKVAEYLKLDTVADFLKFLEYFNDFVQQLLKEMEDAYWEMVNIARLWSKFDQAEFDRDNGIEEDRQTQFLNTILKLYSVGKKIFELGQAYEMYKNNG